MFDNEKLEQEITHSKMLARQDTDCIWGWSGPAGRMRAKRRARMIIKGAGLATGMRVLEIGCGTGVFTEIFAQAGPKLIGLDICGDLLVKARARNLSINQVSFVESSFERADLDGPFDAIVGSSILHHLTDTEEILIKIHKLLKPKGVMCFTEPNILNPQVFFERNTRFIRGLLSYISDNETAFLRWRLYKLINKIGFTDIKIIPFDWLHPRTTDFLIGFVTAIGCGLEKIPILKELAGSLFIYAKR